MKRTYLGAVCGEPNSYGVVFRDLPGCVSAGATIDNVLESGAEALRGHLESMLEDGEAVPDPTPHTLADVESWLADDGDEIDEVWVGLFPVAVEIPEQADTVTIRMKADLVRHIAEMASKSAANFDSRSFIESAVEHELDRYRKSA